jgi:hypothetical protein
MTTATATPPRPEVLERDNEIQVSGALEAQTRGEVDIQIATAKRYPRSIKTFINTALEMATLDEQTAEACFYSIPRDGKTVTGPSARLAEICASAYGHLRVQARVVDEDDRFITSRGEAWDVQNNVAIGFEVRRRISGKNNKKYSDDMITVTGNAASSIALRNAIFKTIPSAFWRPIFEKAREVAVGTQETLAVRRKKMLDYFQKIGIENARVFSVLKINGEPDITLDQLATLKGLATAIKEGDTSIDEAFPAPTQTVPMPQRQSEQAAQQQASQQAPPETPKPPTPPTADVPADAVRLATFQEVAQAGKPTSWTMTDSKGRKLFTKEQNVAAPLSIAHGAEMPVVFSELKPIGDWLHIVGPVRVIQ